MSASYPYYPLFFTPVLKDYLWGGRNLATKLGRQLPAEGIIAESWEIAAHPDGTTVVQNGAWAGEPLTAVQAAWGVNLVGSRSQWALDRQKFPLLIKLLDANQNLSVQVHPDDAYALAHEGNELGKTEMWVVLHAQPHAQLILGVTPGTTAANFAQAAGDGHLEPHLHYLPVQTGDHVCVPAGSLHAIMGGLLIAEIQQNSNTTYRAYDWNRVGADGQPRPLHLEQALAVTNFDQVAPELCPPTAVEHADGITQERLCHNKYFTVERWQFPAGTAYAGELLGETLEIWGVIHGRGTISTPSTTDPLDSIQFTLLPAALGAFQITADTPLTCLRTYVGDDSMSLS